MKHKKFITKIGADKCSSQITTAQSQRGYFYHQHHHWGWRCRYSLCRYRPLKKQNKTAAYNGVNKEANALLSLHACLFDNIHFHFHFYFDTKSEHYKQNFCHNKNNQHSLWNCGKSLVVCCRDDTDKCCHSRLFELAGKELAVFLTACA